MNFGLQNISPGKLSLPRTSIGTAVVDDKGKEVKGVSMYDREKGRRGGGETADGRRETGDWGRNIGLFSEINLLLS